jgi:hypothetical protein
MSTNPEVQTPIPAKRPALVWVISIFYFLSAGWTTLSLALVLSGGIPLTSAQQQYFSSLTAFDHASTLVVGISNLAGAVLLLLLRRPAYRFFAGAFALGLLLTLRQVLAGNWLGAIGGAGLIGAAIGLAISVAVILYARGLVKQGVLR